MPIYFTSLQLITTVRYLELLCKADLVVKTLKGVIKCLLEIEHTLQHDNIRRRTLGYRNVNVPLQRCRPLSPTCLRAAQLFLFFFFLIWSAKAEIFACKLWRAWIQLLSTHFTHIDIRMDGCQFSVLAGVQTRWLLSLLGFHDLKKIKKEEKKKKTSLNTKQKTLHKHFWDATGLIFFFSSFVSSASGSNHLQATLSVKTSS